MKGRPRRAVELNNEIEACAHMIAVEIAESKGDVRERHDWNLKALEHADRSSDQRAASWYASLYGSVGITNLRVGRDQSAGELGAWSRPC